MGLFKLKKNKRYSYSGRFSEDTSYVGKHAVPKKIKSKFDEFRTTAGDDNSFRKKFRNAVEDYKSCLLYTSPSPRDPKTSRMPSSA